MSGVHCWAGNAEHAEREHGYWSPEHRAADARRAICLLPDGHDGPHEWTPLEDVAVEFPAPNPRSTS